MLGTDSGDRDLASPVSSFFPPFAISGLGRGWGGWGGGERHIRCIRKAGLKVCSTIRRGHGLDHRQWSPGPFPGGVASITTDDLLNFTSLVWKVWVSCNLALDIRNTPTSTKTCHGAWQAGCSISDSCWCRVGPANQYSGAFSRRGTQAGARAAPSPPTASPGSAWG